MIRNHINTVFLSHLLHFDPHTDFCKRFSDALVSAGIIVNFLDYSKDFWLRDFMPVQVANDEFVQFALTKDYYRDSERHKQTDPAPICKALGIEPKIPKFDGKPIYLDGGNVIRGYDKAIITDKVYADNEIPRESLIRIIQDALQGKQVITIPVEPYDDTGHADGMVRFLDENTVIANDYVKAGYGKKFRDRFYGTLRDCGLDVQIVPYYPVSIRNKGLWVALGCYINFLKVKSKIFLPTFDNEAQDVEAVASFSEIFGADNVIPIPSKMIALEGGVLNCLSWEIQS